MTSTPPPASPTDPSDATAMAATVEDDPYQVYMLRHPAERASSIVPQLPKQPEMAETRLRYRRIAPNARSGSIGSLGGHFPRRFQFPQRPSLLESLTSDDEPSSFAVRRRRAHASRRRRRRRARRVAAAVFAADPVRAKREPAHPAKTLVDPPLIHLPHTAAPLASLTPLTPLTSLTPLTPLTSLTSLKDAVTPASDSPSSSFASSSSSSSTPLSTSPTTPMPSSPLPAIVKSPFLPEQLAHTHDKPPLPANPALPEDIPNRIADFNATIVEDFPMAPVLRMSDEEHVRATRSWHGRVGLTNGGERSSWLRLRGEHSVKRRSANLSAGLASLWGSGGSRAKRASRRLRHARKGKSAVDDVTTPSVDSSHRDSSGQSSSRQMAVGARDSARDDRGVQVPDLHREVVREVGGNVDGSADIPEELADSSHQFANIVGYAGRDKDLSVSFAHRPFENGDERRPISAIHKLWRVLAIARSPFHRMSARRKN